MVRQEFQIKSNFDIYRQMFIRKLNPGARDFPLRSPLNISTNLDCFRWSKFKQMHETDRTSKMICVLLCSILDHRFPSNKSNQ